MSLPADMNTQSILAILVVGLGAGVLSGMFGIGGGLIIVPALVILFGFEQKTATGTSLFALLLPVGIFAVLDYASRNKVHWWYGFLITPGLLLGAKVGAWMTRGLSDLMLKRVYAAFLVVVAIYYFVISTETGRSWIKPRTGLRPADAAVAPRGDAPPSQ